MSSIVYYLLQVIVSSGILYLYYQAFLRNKRFHQYNRFFLLGTVVMSILIPFLHIPVHFTQEQTTSSVVARTLTILSSPQDVMLDNTGFNHRQNSSSVNTIDLVYCFYALIAVLALVRIIYGLFRIKKLGSRYPVEKLGNIKFVNTDDAQAPFSFFNWLFWNRAIELKSEKGEQVFRHELFHIRQRHSLDIVFLEIVSMILWINPFFHLIKKEIRAIHEFLADQYALDKGGHWNYAETLLMHALQTKHSLINPFFHNQIKRRIAMITNPQKTSHQYLRKLLVLPVAAIVITLFAFSYRKEKPFLQQAEAPITVIIDAGHGGIDPGAKSPDNQFSEADLTLSLAKTVQRLSSEYNIKVVMTRQDDKLPGGTTNKDEGLRKRVELSYSVSPRIFISLHMNNAGSKGFQEEHSGIEAYVTNKRKDDPGKAAASLLLQELSTVYKTAADLKYRQDAGIFILDRNICPTVLLQCGYINNRNDLEFIKDPNNQEKIARSILRGIVSYNKKLAVQHLPTAILADSLPKLYNMSLNINISEDFVLKGEKINMYMPGKGPDNQSKFELIVLNGQRLTLSEAKEMLSGAFIKSADVSIIPANDKDAIEKYGELAKTGVLVITDAIVEKPAVKTEPLLRNQETDPLIVIDGKILPRAPLTKEQNDQLSYLDPNTIKSMTILKGQSAIDLYQEKGKNGVIIIETKKNTGMPLDSNKRDTAELIVRG
jgi:N-acetylmuramoyl-L-alanine amidase